jgi:uncharacterized phage-like protein YoqJ
MKWAVTGHRPNKLAGYGEAAEIELINFAEQKIKPLEPSEVYIGMALGWDQACAWACHRLKIPFYACCPFQGFDKFWRQRQRDRLAILLKKAKQVIYVCDPPSEFENVSRQMERRNLYMMENGVDGCLALWNGTPGGTANAIEICRALNRPYVNVWDDYAKTPAYRHFQANQQKRPDTSNEPF